MKAYFREGIPGYGRRIYLTKLDSLDRVNVLCKALSAWGGVDKEDMQEYWNSFEFPPFEDIDFKTLLERYCNIEFVEWEEFLQFCADEKAKVGF